MPRTPRHKARTRERVIDAAAARFRRHGFADARVDEIMADAGLTHGGFYAHFPSKAALFVEVLATRNDLLRRLCERSGPDVRAQGREILDAYVNPAHQAFVGPGCTIASLAVEAGRHGDAAREAIAAMIDRLANEIGRGEAVRQAPDAARAGRNDPQAQDDPNAGAATRGAALAALAAAVGAVALARGCAGTPLADELLTAVRERLSALLDGASPPVAHAPGNHQETRS